jgi:hypothetical protein
MIYVIIEYVLYVAMAVIILFTFKILKFLISILIDELKIISKKRR